MLIILVPLFFALLWLRFFEREEEKSLRQSFLKTLLGGFMFCVGTTEVLSFFYLLNPFALGFVWFAAVVGLWLALRGKFKKLAREFSAEIQTKLKSVPRFYGVSILFVYLVVLILALFSPPNTYDSMTYHLARVAHWMQNGSVEFYPTSILRQLYQPPLSEYAILNLQILSNSDYFANLVQWLAFPACGAVVSLILQEFGADLKTQFFGVFLTVTLPGAIVQGSSTQNDLLAAFFVTAFFYFFRRAVKSNSRTDYFWTGGALGLAVLTKATAYLYCFPAGLFLTVVHFLGLQKSDERKRFAKHVVGVLVIAFALNAAHFARNFALFGSPLTSADDEVRNKNITFKTVLTNLARNYAVNLGSKSTGLKNGIESSMKRIFGDELKNPNSTWLDNQFAVNFSTHEDSAGNFVHILLITLALMLVFFVKSEDKKYLYGPVFTILLGFLLFSALLKWQIWTARLHIPLFMLGCVLTAFVVSKLWPKSAFWIALIALASSVPFLIYAEPRRILSNDHKFVLTAQTRHQKYFKNLPDAEKLFGEAVEVIKQKNATPKSVGLHLEYNDFDYAFWILLKRDFRAAPQIFHVGVPNVSKKLGGVREMPEFVISVKTGNVIEDVEYKEIWKKDVVRVLQRESY